MGQAATGSNIFVFKLLAVLGKNGITCRSYRQHFCKLSKPSLRDKSLLVPETFCKGHDTLQWAAGLAGSPVGSRVAVKLRISQPWLSPMISGLPQGATWKSADGSQSQTVSGQPSPRAAVTADGACAPSTLHMREKAKSPKNPEKKTLHLSEM